MMNLFLYMGFSFYIETLLCNINSVCDVSSWRSSPDSEVSLVPTQSGQLYFYFCTILLGHVTAEAEIPT